MSQSIPTPQQFSANQSEAYEQWHSYMKSYSLDPTNPQSIAMFRKAAFEAWHGFDDPRWSEMALLGRPSLQTKRLNELRSLQQTQSRGRNNWAKAVSKVSNNKLNIRQLTKEDWSFLVNKMSRWAKLSSQSKVIPSLGARVAYWHNLALMNSNIKPYANFAAQEAKKGLGTFALYSSSALNDISGLNDAVATMFYDGFRKAETMGIMYVPGADWSVIENAICVCAGINRKDTFIFVSDQSISSNWYNDTSPKVGANEVMWLEAFGYEIDKNASKKMMKNGARGAFVLRHKSSNRAQLPKPNKNNGDGHYTFHDLIDAVPPQYMSGIKDNVACESQLKRAKELYAVVASMQMTVDAMAKKIAFYENL